MTQPTQHRFLIVADGEFGPLTSKTANSCIRYFPERIVAVLDRKQAGKTVQDVLGFGGTIPIVADFEQGIAKGAGATAVLIGIAPPGGRLPEDWRGWLPSAARAPPRNRGGVPTLLGGDPPPGAAPPAEGGRGLHAPQTPPDT